MPNEKKFRYQLEVFWNGHWAKLWGSDKRIELDEYAAQCTDPNVQFRVTDGWEEEVTKCWRRNKP